MYSLFSPYGEKLDTTRPLQDYPRPQLMRDSYLNLNGYWRYCITTAQSEPTVWDGEILVPFSPECPLSGLGRILQPDETLWYERRVVFVSGFLKQRVLLHFGAVDQCCVIYWNGREVTRHTGGYLPFSCDVTNELCAGENLLRVKVIDETEMGPYMRGRQNRRGKAGWRPAFSGIWQTVWMESLPSTYISAYRITPLYDEQAIEIEVQANEEGAEGELAVLALATEVARRPFRPGETLRVDLPGALSWHPRNPFLYTLSLRLGEDEVQGYFGMRKFSLEPDATGHLRFCLNNRPLLLRGILDEGFFSDGFYTPPSDRAIRDDLAFAKQCGFNLIRKYGKIEPLRWYHHCDTAGLLVWQDLPGGGEEAHGGLLGRLSKGPLKDKHYRHFGRESPQGRELFLRDSDAIAAHLYNCAGLCAYTLFDEGYGQFDALELTARMKQQDASRLVDHAGGCYDQGGGDFYSLHCLSGLPHVEQNVKNRAFALTACGGYGQVARTLFTAEGCEAPQMLPPNRKLADALEELWASLTELEQRGLAAFCYYRLSDAGKDTSGLLSANRREKRIDPKVLATLNGAFFLK